MAALCNASMTSASATYADQRSNALDSVSKPLMSASASALAPVLPKKAGVDTHRDFHDDYHKLRRDSRATVSTPVSVTTLIDRSCSHPLNIRVRY